MSQFAAPITPKGGEQLPAAHAFKDEMDAAKSALDEARRLYPKLSIKWLTWRKPILQPAFEVLRKAGMPEE
jgi:hypothetical protein